MHEDVKEGERLFVCIVFNVLLKSFAIFREKKSAINTLKRVKI